jgi:ubiquinone/menaquinone biosynthesis C-methylase UbiE
MITQAPTTESSVDYESLTEIAGEEVSQEQVDRMVHRYAWAGAFCAGKDVIEVACGSGQGLGHLGGLARTLRAGDVSPALVATAKRIYGEGFPVEVLDAHHLPYPDRSADVILLFEAIYYLRSPDEFLAECARVLRPGGKVLVATANKDLYDFNPSPHSHFYFGAADLPGLFVRHGFTVRLFGDTPIEAVSMRQRILRPVKKLAVSLNLMPRTMAAKRLLKRLVFGQMVPMPERIEIPRGMTFKGADVPAGEPDRRHKVILCEATLTA